MDYFQKANELYNTKDYENAINMYQLAARNKDNEASSLYNAAVCHIKLKDYLTAVPLLKSAIHKKTDSKYFFNLAYCYTMLKDYKKAFVYFNTAWSLDNSDSDCEKAVDLILEKIIK